MTMPCGLAPNSCRLSPLGDRFSFETRLQVPTSCSLSVFSWARTALWKPIPPIAVPANTHRTVVRFAFIDLSLLQFVSSPSPLLPQQGVQFADKAYSTTGRHGP